MTDQAAADSPTPDKQLLAGARGGSMYVVDTTPERRSVTKVTGEPGNFQIEQVSDYQSISKFTDEIRQYSAKPFVKTEGSPDEFADLDDDPWLQQLLITAWTQVAQYYSNCEPEDRTEAKQVMTALSAMIADDESDDTAAGNTFTCEYCQRNFASESAALNHLANVHAAREKETKMKTERD